MFEHLKKHDRIFVCGPNRSGTTIAARIIAADTGHDLVLEDDFGYSRLDKFAAFVNGDRPVVIQCPFLTPIIHDLPYLIGFDISEAMVVMMRRPTDEIIDSENRAVSQDGTKIAFHLIGEARKKRVYHDHSDKHISTVCYDAWEEQKRLIPTSVDVDYYALRGHPLWVEDRNFTVRQTADDDETDLTVKKEIKVPLHETMKALMQ